jgi:hypothetical protein
MRMTTDSQDGQSVLVSGTHLGPVAIFLFFFSKFKSGFALSDIANMYILMMVNDLDMLSA